MDLRGAARGSLILLAALGCATSHSLKAQEDSRFEKVEHQEASGEKHEGPWTETVYEFGEESGVRESNPSDRFGRPMPLPIGQPRPDTVPETGPLVKVTIRQHGGTDEAWRASGSGLTGAETHLALAKADKTEPSSGCALGLGFWLAVGLGLLAFGGWVWLKRSLP